MRDNDAVRVRRPAEIPYVVHLGTFLSGGVGNVLIADNWPDLLRLAGSIHTGAVSAHGRAADARPRRQPDPAM